MTQDEALKIFEESGALLTGHFILTSGRHSDRYFEKFDVLRYPKYVATLCEDLAAKLAPTEPEMILGPTTLGILLAYEVAKNLGVPAAYGEKGADGLRFLRRPAHLPVGSRVAIVDDILTTGGSIRECVQLLETQGASLVGVGVLVDRAGGKLDFGVPLEATLSLNVESWEEGEVPDWLSQVPITRPGSTGKK